MRTVARMNTLKDVLTEKCITFKDNIAYLEKDHEKQIFNEITYGQFRKDIIALGTALLNRNLKGKKIVVIGENSYRWMVSYMAVTCGVGIIVPIDKELPANEIENLIKISQASAIIYSSKKKEEMDKIRKNLTGVELFIEMNKEKSDNDTASYNDLLSYGNEFVDSGDNSYMEIEIKPKDFTVLLFTSGTTASPKGVMICHQNITTSAFAAGDVLPITSDDRFLSVLPIHHTYELTGTYIFCLANGASVAICEGLKYIQKDLTLAKPTAMMVVPLILEKLNRKIQKGIKEKGKEKLVKMVVNVFKPFGDAGKNLKRKLFKDIYAEFGGNLKYIFCGAASIEKGLAQSFEDLGFYFIQGYGLTETAPLITGTFKETRVIGSIGKEIQYTKTKIFEPNEQGIGEIITSGDNVFLGYYENEEETKRAIRDGWFHTGDLGYADKDGNYYMTGRSKNVIVTKNGKNIFPEEIEERINKIDMVLESLVYGEEDKEDKTDVTVTALVTLDQEYITEKYGKSRPTVEEIYKEIWNEIKKINATLVTYKAVKKLVIKEDDFVKTTTMKIKRFAEIDKHKNKK